MTRNLKRLRSSGRVPVARPSDEGRASGLGRTSTRLKPVRNSSSKLNPVRKSSGQLDPVSPVPESQLFRAMVPPPEVDDEVEALREEVANLRRLQEVIHFLGSSSDAHAVRAEILDLAISISGLSRGMIALPASSQGKRRYKVKETRGYTEETKAEVKLLRGILNRALERRETFFDGSIKDGGILDHADPSAKKLDLGAVASLPLEAGGELWGALILDDPRRKAPFSPAEESLLRSFARHAGLSLARLHKASQLKKRLTLTTRKNERLEAERDQLEERMEAEARRAQEASEQRRRGARTSSQSARHDKKLEKSGREYRRLLEVSYGRAREDFTRRYLEELMRRSEGDLRLAADESGLPVARLIGLLERLEVPVPPRRLPLPERPAQDHGSTASRWGQAARR